MKKLLNKIKELYKKSSLFRIVVILLIWALIIFEWKNIYVDRYNFQQLEKAKKVIENIPENKKTYSVRNLKQLNSKFKADIEPLDKRYCYYVYYQFDKEKNKSDFEFWFKLHSLLYKLMYMSNNYAYPKPIEKPKPSKECERQAKASIWYTWVPACFWWYYHIYLDTINEPCER
jgi:hypothetical protein